MKGLCETPGLKYAGSMQAPTEAAAMLGRKPARTRIGIIVGATEADRPAIDGMAVAMMLVTTMQAGRSSRPRRFRGAVSRRTRCTSHFVTEMTPAKPMAEQIAMMSEAFVIDLSNCLKAIIGSSEMSAMSRPEASSTRRVS